MCNTVYEDVSRPLAPRWVDWFWICLSIIFSQSNFLQWRRIRRDERFPCCLPANLDCGNRRYSFFVFNKNNNIFITAQRAKPWDCQRVDQPATARQVSSYYSTSAQLRLLTTCLCVFFCKFTKTPCVSHVKVNH